MRRRGRPILGAFSGLLLGIFLAVDLHLFQVWSLSKSSEIILPGAGLVLGFLLGLRPLFGAKTSRYSSIHRSTDRL